MTQPGKTPHEPPVANSKAELLAQLAPSRLALEEAIGKLSEAQLSAPGPDGWSVKDHLAHLVVWERKVLATMEGAPVHESLGVPEQVYESASEDELNAVLHAMHQHRPAAEVVADLRASRAALLAAIEGLSDAQLAAPYDPNDPSDSRRLIDAISNNSFRHDWEHTGWVNGLIGQ